MAHELIIYDFIYDIYRSEPSLRLRLNGAMLGTGNNLISVTDLLRETRGQKEETISVKEEQSPYPSAAVKTPIKNTPNASPMKFEKCVYLLR